MRIEHYSALLGSFILGGAIGDYWHHAWAGGIILAAAYAASLLLRKAQP